jgi:hypothetical protein
MLTRTTRAVEQIKSIERRSEHNFTCGQFNWRLACNDRRAHTFDAEAVVAEFQLTSNSARLANIDDRNGCEFDRHRAGCCLARRRFLETDSIVAWRYSASSIDRSTDPIRDPA